MSANGCSYAHMYAGPVESGKQESMGGCVEWEVRWKIKREQVGTKLETINTASLDQTWVCEGAR